MEDYIRDYIEKEHNVILSTDGEYFTTGDPKDDYGWIPTPEKWINEAILVEGIIEYQGTL